MTPPASGVAEDDQCAEGQVLDAPFALAQHCDEEAERRSGRGRAGRRQSRLRGQHRQPGAPQAAGTVQPPERPGDRSARARRDRGRGARPGRLPGRGRPTGRGRRRDLAAWTRGARARGPPPSGRCGVVVEGGDEDRGRGIGVGRRGERIDRAGADARATGRPASRRKRSIGTASPSRLAASRPATRQCSSGASSSSSTIRLARGSWWPATRACTRRRLGHAGLGSPASSAIAGLGRDGRARVVRHGRRAPGPRPRGRAIRRRAGRPAAAAAAGGGPPSDASASSAATRTDGSGSSSTARMSAAPARSIGRSAEKPGRHAADRRLGCRSASISAWSTAGSGSARRGPAHLRGPARPGLPGASAAGSRA